MAPPAVEQQIILTHPDPESFCASVAKCWIERVSSHHQNCTLRDLYAEGFDPVLKINERPGKPGYAPPQALLDEGQRLETLDVIVLIYPVWFGSPPAMMKGYLERVLGNATFFASEGPTEKPLRRARLVQISTSRTRSSWLAEKGVESALHTLFDRYLADVLGAHHTHRLNLDAITNTMTPGQGAMELEQVRQLADKVCAEANAARWERAQAK